MNQYKPEYMGKVLPADNPSKLNDFVTNKYDAFSKAYDACKDFSTNINDVTPVDKPTGSTEFSMNISTDTNTIKKILEKGLESISIQGTVLTAK